MTDTAAWERMLESMRVFFRSVPPPSAGGRVVELDGVIAAVTPAVPERSLPNSVVYETEDHLIAALDELAELYDDAGVQAWTVWTPEYHERARAALAEAGSLLDANSRGDDRGPRRDRAAPGRVTRSRTPSHGPRTSALINDLAYSSGDAFQRLLGGGALAPDNVYIAHVDGRPAGSVVTQDHGGDCSVWWVAVVPEARGKGAGRRPDAAGARRRAGARLRGHHPSGHAGLAGPRTSGSATGRWARSRCGSAGPSRAPRPAPLAPRT